MKAPEASLIAPVDQATALPGRLIIENAMDERPPLQTGTFMETSPLVR
jgi:hypothetical protein